MAKYSAGAGASGAISGAMTGGSIGGLPGALVGGVIGGGLGLFGSKKKKKKKISTLDKRQQQLNESQHQAVFGEGPLADLYNYDPQAANSVFDQIYARPSYRNFQENVIPSITGQFRSQGLQNSSYVGGALAKEGRNVQENLDALRSQYLYNEQNAARTSKQNAIENLQNRQTFAYDKAAPQSGFNIDSVLKKFTPEVISGIKDYFNKPGAV